MSQQHRLVGLDTAMAPILLALNASAIYLAISAAGAGGALAIGLMDPHDLPLVTSVLVVVSLFCAELAYWLIRRKSGNTAR